MTGGNGVPASPSGSREPDPSVPALRASIPNAAMLFRVARAICCGESGGCAALCDGSEFTVCQAGTYMRDARAAIVAMRDPTAAMVASVLPEIGNPSDDDRRIGAMACARLGSDQPVGFVIAAEMVRDWRAMIDSALAAASAIEARSDETRPGLGPQGESAVAESETPNPGSHPQDRRG